jgi:hypothetical protein
LKSGNTHSQAIFGQLESTFAAPQTSGEENGNQLKKQMV